MQKFTAEEMETAFKHEPESMDMFAPGVMSKIPELIESAIGTPLFGVTRQAYTIIFITGMATGINMITNRHETLIKNQIDKMIEAAEKQDQLKSLSKEIP